MNGFLVILRHNLDDFPMGLFSSIDDAMTFAREWDWYPSDELIHRVGFPNAGTPVSICIVIFIGGRPVRMEKVRDFESEEDRDF